VMSNRRMQVQVKGHRSLCRRCAPSSFPIPLSPLRFYPRPR